MEIGKLIILEGADGIGKTTLSKMTTDWLVGSGQNAVFLSFPGNVAHTLGQLVYEIHHHHQDQFAIPNINPLSLQVLHIAAHIDEIDRAIRPSIEAGTWVVLDRFWWSTWVYGMAANANQRCLELVIDAEREYWGALKPDVVFRIARHEAIRQEHSQGSFARLSSLYEEIALRESEKTPVHTIENGSLDVSFRAMVTVLNSLRENQQPSL